MNLKDFIDLASLYAIMGAVPSILFTFLDIHYLSEFFIFLQAEAVLIGIIGLAIKYISRFTSEKLSKEEEG